MTSYYLGWAYMGKGDIAASLASFEMAEKTDSYCCFPNRLEDVLVLSLAKSLNPGGARAPYYLGCLYYDKRQYDLSIENWELSAKRDPEFPTVWRNLALARYNKQDRRDEAVEYMERAFRLDESDSRILMELDQLYKRMHRPHSERLAFLERYPELVGQRDDLLLEQITLLNQIGELEKAKRLLDGHVFHPWEGGEGKVPAQYQISRVELAKKAIAAKDYGLAVSYLEECLEYPFHLGEGKLAGAQENDFHYLLGCAWEGLGEHSRAISYWEKATEGPQEPAAALYYNDSKPEMIFYQGLALKALGREDEARERFEKLIAYGREHYSDKVVMDYFAVSLPDLLIWDDDLQTRNEVHCSLMLALGYLGLGDSLMAEEYLGKVESLDPNHQTPQSIRSLPAIAVKQ